MNRLFKTSGWRRGPAAALLGILAGLAAAAGSASPAAAQTYRSSAEAESAAEQAAREWQRIEQDRRRVAREVAEVRARIGELNREHQERIAALRSALDEAHENYDARTRALQQRNGELNEQYTAQAEKANERIGELQAELRDLLVEKKRALDELRLGFFCDQCWRTKSEIERQERVPFGEHLSDVQGTAVPAPPEKIQEKEEEFDRKIAAVQKRLADAQASKAELRRRYEEQLDRLRDDFRAARTQLDAEVARLRRQMRSEDEAHATRVRQLNLRARDLEAQSRQLRASGRSLRWREQVARMQIVTLRYQERIRGLTGPGFEPREQRDRRAFGGFQLPCAPEGVWQEVRGTGGQILFKVTSGSFARADKIETWFWIDVLNNGPSAVRFRYEVLHPVSSPLGPTRRLLRVAELGPGDRTGFHRYRLYSFFCPRVELIDLAPL